MRKKSIFFVLMSIAIFLWMGSVYAGDFTFGDDTIHWNTWPSTTDSTDNTKDVVGFPAVSGGGGSIDSSNNLTSVHFDYSNSGGTPVWGDSTDPPNSYILTGEIGDVFISDATDHWDYVIIGKTRDTGDSSTSAIQGEIYSFGDTDFSSKKGDNDDLYVLSDDAWPHGGNIRNDHPVWYDREWDVDNNTTPKGTKVGTGSVSLFNNSNTTLTFSNLGNLINVGSQAFRIAWTETCANDVVNEVIPEPATMFLFGSGLLGLAGFSRRRLKKK